MAASHQNTLLLHLKKFVEGIELSFGKIRLPSLVTQAHGQDIRGVWVTVCSLCTTSLLSCGQIVNHSLKH